jgi:hypothetical protein
MANGAVRTAISALFAPFAIRHSPALPFTTSQSFTRQSDVESLCGFEDLTMRRVVALAGFAFGLGVAVTSFTVLPNGTSRAAPTKAEATFLIPASDGYGVADCLSNPDSDCGRVVAGAWCEAQGYARASAFGIASKEDHTGSVEPASLRPAKNQPLVITCVD